MREKNTEIERETDWERQRMRVRQSERERDRMYHRLQPDSSRIGSIIEYSLRIECCRVI